jgi:hypothetical protein
MSQARGHGIKEASLKFKLNIRLAFLPFRNPKELDLQKE